MRTRALLLSLVSLSGCLNFDGLLDAGCSADAAWAECRPPASDGGDAGQVFPDGGFCSSSGWCWENPGGPGAVDLFAVWGTSDTDVWVAGSGGAVLRFNGTRWWQTDVQLNPDVTLTQPEAAVRAVTIDDAGVAWLAGEAMPVVGLSPGGVTRVGSAANRIGAATYGGRSFFLPAGSSPFSIERLQGGVLTSLPVPSATGVDNLLAITADETGALVAYDRVSPNAAQVFQVSSMTGTTLTTPAATEVRTPRNFAARGTTKALVCSNGDAFESTSANAWSYVGQVSLGQDLRTHALQVLPDGGARWWFGGSEGAIASVEGALDAGLTTYAGTPTAILQASWVSPSGHFWAVGSAGAVVEVSAADMSVRNRGALSDATLLDLAVTAEKTVAVGRGGVMLTRNAQSGTWTRTMSPTFAEYRAVSVGPLGTCTVDLFGEVVCDDVAVFSPNALQRDGGLYPLGARGGAAMAQRADGGAVMAVGGYFASYSGGAWSQVDAGVVVANHTGDLVLDPNGFTVAINTTNEVDELVNGAVVTFGGGTPRFCGVPAGPVLGLAATASGLLVVGPNVVGECVNGTFTSVAPPAMNRTWVSAWVDANGGWWILENGGLVFRRAAGATGWVRERLPLGESGLDGPATTRLLGDADEVFVIGKSGTVLRRRLP